MKKLLMFLFFAIFLLSLASAQIETKYYIYQNKVLVDYYFDSVSGLELRIPYDAEKLDVSVNYTLHSFENYKTIEIDSAENLSINYLTKSMIDKTKRGYYFISKNYLNKSQKVKLVLPESAVLSEQGLLFPKPDLITTDGRSIILEWEDYDNQQIIVDYEFIKKNVLVWYLIFLVVVLFFITFYIYKSRLVKKRLRVLKEKVKKAKKRQIKKAKENVTRNLFGEEKKIIKYLLEKKGRECWTKELARDLEISKVRLSRRLRGLEQKEIIQRTPYGNENRIKLLKIS